MTSMLETNWMRVKWDGFAFHSGMYGRPDRHKNSTIDHAERAKRTKRKKQAKRQRMRNL